MEIEFGDGLAEQWSVVTIVEFYQWAERQQEEARRLLAELYLVSGVLERLRGGQGVSARTCECAREAAEQLRDIASVYGFADMGAILGEAVRFFRTFE